MIAAVHDWKTVMSGAVKGTPYPDTIWHAAYSRPDGTLATVFGSSACCLLVEGNHTAAEPTSHTAQLTAPKFTGAAIDNVFTTGVLTIPVGESSTAALVALAGEPVPPIEKSKPCPVCKGDGEIECPCCGQDANCVECDGAGEVKTVIEPSPRTITHAGHHFDARVLAPVLAVVPDERVRVEFGERPGLGYLRLVGAGWQILLIDRSVPREEGEFVDLVDAFTLKE